MQNKFKNKVFVFFKFLGYYFLTLLLSVILIFFIDTFITKTLGYPSIMELFSKSKRMIDKKGIWLIIFVIPLIEEILFRLFLRVNKFNIATTIILWILVIISKDKITDLDFKSSVTYIHIVIVIAIGFLLYKYILTEAIIKYLTNKKYKLFYLSILSFGLIHLTNINEFYWQLSLFYPFYVLPQIAMGYFIGRLRMEQGFFWGILFHSIINAIGSL